MSAIDKLASVDTLAAADKVALFSATLGKQTATIREVKMHRKADLEGRIAIAEQASDLAKRIENTQRVLDGKRDVAAKVEHKSSAVAHQNDALKRWVALAINGDTKASDLQGDRKSVV